MNYSATHSFGAGRRHQPPITLELQIDTSVSDILEYFEIFLVRMMMCRQAPKASTASSV